MANTTGIKHGGRKKGTPNRLTKDIRAVLKNVVSNEIENLETTLDTLNPKEGLDILLKILPYILPKVDKIHCEQDEPIDYLSNYYN